MVVVTCVGRRGRWDGSNSKGGRGSGEGNSVVEESSRGVAGFSDSGVRRGRGSRGEGRGGSSGGNGKQQWSGGWRQVAAVRAGSNGDTASRGGEEKMASGWEEKRLWKGATAGALGIEDWEEDVAA
ncbi:hypothetical protein BHM03_00032229 [Ensete ventricosum]|nr:hypothetical protein BHM03_00032229 [Ensete ventricosum]